VAPLKPLKKMWKTPGPTSLLIKDESDGVTTALEEGVKYNSAWILEMFFVSQTGRLYRLSDLTTLGERSEPGSTGSVYHGARGKQQRTKPVGQR
jgi:hypothetical protein